MAQSSLDELPRNHFRAILADPPWHFQCWVETGHSGSKLPGGGKNYGSSRGPTYGTLKENDLTAMPIADMAARDSVLFLWTCWPVLEQSLRLIKSWGFKYKTCGFCWIKANTSQIDMFRDDATPRMGLGYWTRANSEVCLLATRGKPKRLSPNVRQGIIEPLREHSRKPDGVHDRIERLVSGPYLELFARQQRPNWTCWGNEVDKFKPDPQQETWEEMWYKPFDYPERL